MSGAVSGAATTLNRTPLHEFHVRQGAKLVEFAGWSMPMLYRSIIEEHRQVRSSGGLFDVSHMGRLRFRGEGSGRFLDRLVTRAVTRMADGQCRYGLVCNERGGCRDDMLVYRLGPADHLMVCNAANRLKLLEHFGEALRRFDDLDVQIADETVQTAMPAIQGPKVMALVADAVPQVAGLKRYRFVRCEVGGAEAIVSRTGYTGEDGVEVIVAADAAEQVIERLVGDVSAEGAAVRPAGLGARDTLRMEAAMPLYGHEITEQRNPLAAGLSFAVELDKGRDGRSEPFIGQEALQRIADEGPADRLVGLRLQGRRTARAGMAVRDGRDPVGAVTSACLSPTLEVPIAMAYVPAALAEPGRALAVDLGRTAVEAEVVKLPFFERD